MFFSTQDDGISSITRQVEENDGRTGSLEEQVF
jgi:hypothetical protein